MIKVVQDCPAGRNDEQCMKMYGTSLENMNSILDHVYSKDIAGVQMMAMSILSDAQEEMARGNNETARHYINRSKYLMSLITSAYRNHVENQES